MILISEKNVVISDQYFFQFVVSHFGNSPMATECMSSLLSLDIESVTYYCHNDSHVISLLC